MSGPTMSQAMAAAIARLDPASRAAALLDQAAGHLTAAPQIDAPAASAVPPETVRRLSSKDYEQEKAALLSESVRRHIVSSSPLSEPVDARKMDPKAYLDAKREILHPTRWGAQPAATSETARFGDSALSQAERQAAHAAFAANRKRQ